MGESLAIHSLFKYKEVYIDIYGCFNSFEEYRKLECYKYLDYDQTIYVCEKLLSSDKEKEELKLDETWELMKIEATLIICEKIYPILESIFTFNIKF